MDIKIKLNKGNFIQMAEPFTVKETDDVFLKFETDFNLYEAKIVIQNGSIIESFNYSSRFKIPDRLMFAGYLNIKIEMYILNKVVKRWEILPLKILQTPEGLKIIDHLSAIDKRLSEIENYLDII